MAGIYIHIPYCRQKCSYCNFYSLATTKYRERLIPALVNEMQLQRDYLEGEIVQTIYFGGGTPSLMRAGEINRALSAVYNIFGVDSQAEITLEANPDDLRAPKLHALKQAGINRLSIGIQSFEDADLRFLGRSHSAAQARNCIDRAQNAGFSNLSIDLIYGIPTLDSESWESNLLTALSCGIPHISAYALTVEEKTPMALKIKRGSIPDVDDEVQLQHFGILRSLLQAHGYQHYEISNFCVPGMFSKHNTSYWQGKKYLGIGPSAHSFNWVSRQWNIAGIGPYLESVNKGIVPFEMEMLTKAQRFNEYVMTSLRTMWGCDLKEIEKMFGESWAFQALADARQFLENKMMVRKDGVLYLTNDGLFHADGIASEFFRVE